MKPIAQLLIHNIKNRSTNPAFAAVMTNDMKNDMSNAMHNAVKIFLFLLNVFLFPRSVLHCFFSTLDTFSQYGICVDHIRFADDEYSVCVAAYSFLNVDARI
jgi:hypothetical protein